MSGVASLLLTVIWRSRVSSSKANMSQVGCVEFSRRTILTESHDRHCHFGDPATFLVF